MSVVYHLKFRNEMTYYSRSTVDINLKREVLLLADNVNREPMLDMFIFESIQLLDQLEKIILKSEKATSFDIASINEIFRIMHTIKGSAAMMMFNNISLIAHAVEDLFYFLREEKPKKIKHAMISDLVLSAEDFIKNEIGKIEEGASANGDPTGSIETIKKVLAEFKSDNKKSEAKDEEKKSEETRVKEQRFYIGACKELKSSETNIFEVCIFFEDGCEMENIRAFTLVHNIKDKVEVLRVTPADILENDETKELIRALGFRFVFKTKLDENAARELFSDGLFISSLELTKLEEEPAEVKSEIEIKPEPERKAIVLEDQPEQKETEAEGMTEASAEQRTMKQNFISVNLSKLDKLMDLVGELVISESMVTRNPDLRELNLENFSKAARQLRKLTSELQDIVMSIRMVPLTATFQKMNRIVRDMSKKLKKDVNLEIIGEETEVDKNIIENISDPLMHLIRNSLDHGLESPEERLSKEKPKTGKVVLEAKNSGGDVWIIVRDDGKGLNKEKILAKAREHGLFKKPESELTDNEIYNFILLPGFSTNENVTEYSGRGVGMDVVLKNIEKIGGTIVIDSIPEVGSTFSIKIPLTLAIIDGMVVNVGKSSYVVPTVSIKESFRPKEGEVIQDPDGNEMILIRGACYPVLRLNELFNVNTRITKMEEGIIMMVQNENRGLCLFADALIGEQQVVVKALPKYIKKIHGIAGCTMLGDGSISLILDAGTLLTNQKER